MLQCSNFGSVLVSLRLNLGCGNKLYSREDRWINVDIVEPKSLTENVGTIHEEVVFEGNVAPLFHQSSLQNLCFVDDGCVDEIHAYHVIEHFFRNEVQDLLKEWKRVLKPGGTIHLEQPDVIKCAANFIAGLCNGDASLSYNLGFLGFYGDGTSKEPFMGHKWGWHPSSLMEELEKAGFTGVVETAPQTHMKEVRDFRIEGIKESNNVR